MVVPINDSKAIVNLSETKKFVGNNLQLRFTQNKCTLVIIGNNCTIKVAENYGVVKVIGNNCVVEISKCYGSVDYIGNGGKITTEQGAKPDAVSYKGQNGKIPAKNEKSKSENCIKIIETSDERSKCLENLQVFIRPQIYIKDNVKIPNPRIKINTFDLKHLFSSGILIRP